MPTRINNAKNPANPFVPNPPITSVRLPTTLTPKTPVPNTI